MFMDVVVREQFLHSPKACLDEFDVACSHEEDEKENKVARNDSTIGLLIDEY